MSKHIGSSFDEYLQDEGLNNLAQLKALKRVVAHKLQAVLDQKLFTKQGVADSLNINLTTLAKMLDPEDMTVSINALARSDLLRQR